MAPGRGRAVAGDESSGDASGVGGGGVDGRGCARACQMDAGRMRRRHVCATAAAPAPPALRQPSERALQLSQFAAGALSGLANVVLLSPLEVVKVRLQAQARSGSSSAAALPQRYNGLVHALRVMLREEGWRSYYRGMNASLWAFVPNWALYWFSYEALKRRLTPQHPGASASPFVHLTSALGAGAVTAVATAPLWTLKSRLQTEIAIGARRRRYTGVWSGLRKIVAEEGYSALYKGLSPTLLGLGHVMVQFPVYEHIKSRLSCNQEENLQPAHVLVASSVSKIVASAAFYSHEVVRVRLQLDMRRHPNISEPARVARLYRDVLRTEGIRGLYRGFGTNLLRTVPACMLTFTSYEMAKRFVLYPYMFNNGYPPELMGQKHIDKARKRDCRDLASTELESPRVAKRGLQSW